MSEAATAALTTRVYDQLLRSADAQEGPRAFAEKRQPHWQRALKTTCMSPTAPYCSSTLLVEPLQPGGDMAGALIGCLTPGWSAAQEAFEAVHYQLDVRLDTATRTLQGQVTFTAVWQGEEPLTMLYFFLPPNTLQRPDPREPAAFSDIRYARGFEAASLTVHRVTDGTQRQLPFRLQDDQAVPVGRVPDQAVLPGPAAPVHTWGASQPHYSVHYPSPPRQELGCIRGRRPSTVSGTPCWSHTAAGRGSGACKSSSMPIMPCA